MAGLCVMWTAIALLSLPVFVSAAPKPTPTSFQSHRFQSSRSSIYPSQSSSGVPLRVLKAPSPTKGATPKPLLLRVSPSQITQNGAPIALNNSSNSSSSYISPPSETGQQKGGTETDNNNNKNNKVPASSNGNADVGSEEAIAGMTNRTSESSIKSGNSPTVSNPHLPVNSSSNSSSTSDSKVPAAESSKQTSKQHYKLVKEDKTDVASSKNNSNADPKEGSDKVEEGGGDGNERILSGKLDKPVLQLISSNNTPAEAVSSGNEAQSKDHGALLPPPPTPPTPVVPKVSSPSTTTTTRSSVMDIPPEGQQQQPSFVVQGNTDNVEDEAIGNNNDNNNNNNYELGPNTDLMGEDGSGQTPRT